MTKEALIEKIEALPPEKKAEVEDFVDFLASRDSNSTDDRPTEAFPTALLESIRTERERLRRDRGLFDSLPYIREFRETEGR
jgi:hypothetical protein